jgi:hypothetical protein
VSRPSPLLGVLVALLLTATLVGSGPAPARAAEGVAAAQRRLATLGCAPGPADGDVGVRTRAALVRFQAANRLSQSGRLTAATRDRLAAARKVRCDRRPVVASGGGRRVVISQRQNYVWLVRADGSVLAQGGMIDNTRVLRPGSYTVGSKCGRAAKIRRNSDYSGRLWLNYFTRFAPCGVGFHQIPVTKTSGRQIHADWLLGTDLQQSAGCIRLSRTMAARLWDFAGVGTRVVVR